MIVTPGKIQGVRDRCDQSEKMQGWLEEWQRGRQQSDLSRTENASVKLHDHLILCMHEIMMMMKTQTTFPKQLFSL